MHLPPRPDPATGQPRPPHAPLPDGWRPTTRAGQPVPDALEWHAVSRWFGMSVGLVFSAIGFTYLTVRDGGLDWTSTWWLWLFVLPWPFLGLLRSRQRVAAGADWLRLGRHEISVYRLTEIRLRTKNTDPYLELTDDTGRQLAVTLTVLQRNRELWDLVYNGLLHSTAAGADVNDHTRAQLRLPG